MILSSLFECARNRSRAMTNTPPSSKVKCVMLSPTCRGAPEGKFTDFSVAPLLNSRNILRAFLSINSLPLLLELISSRAVLARNGIPPLSLIREMTPGSSNRTLVSIRMVFSGVATNYANAVSVSASISGSHILQHIERLSSRARNRPYFSHALPSKHRHLAHRSFLREQHRFVIETTRLFCYRNGRYPHSMQWRQPCIDSEKQRLLSGAFTRPCEQLITGKLDARSPTLRQFSCALVASKPLAQNRKSVVGRRHHKPSSCR